MAKALPLAIGGIGLTGAAAGGVFLVKGGGGASATKTNPSIDSGQTQTKISKPEKFFESAQKFKAEAKDSDCVSGHFGSEFTIGDGGTTVIDANKPESTKFFKAATGGQTSESCLVIHWKKVKSDNKWKGTFTWLWTFKQGDEGFINFNIVEPADEDTKFKVSGVFYLVEKNASGVWSAKFKKEVLTAQAKENSNLEAHFPKDKLATGDSDNKYWGFMADATGGVIRDCGQNECEGLDSTKPTFKRLKWTHSGNTASQTNLKEWTEKWEWWNNIYGLQSHWNLEDKAAAVKGAWSADSANV